MAPCFVSIMVAADHDAAVLGAICHNIDIPGAAIVTVWYRDDGVISGTFDNRNRMPNPP